MSLDCTLEGDARKLFQIGKSTFVWPREAMFLLPNSAAVSRPGSVVVRPAKRAEPNWNRARIDTRGAVARPEADSHRPTPVGVFKQLSGLVFGRADGARQSLCSHYGQTRLASH